MPATGPRLTPGDSRPPSSAARKLREHLLLSVLFVASRSTLRLLGLRMNFELDWMFLSDPLELQQRLLETLYYYHAYPPGMNALTGVLLKLGGEHAGLLAEFCFSALGLLLANALLFSFAAFALALKARLLLTLAFCLLPQALYFEHLYLYEHVVAALLCLAGALLFVAVRRGHATRWFAFFLVSSAIGLFRSTYHLAWFAGMIGLALFFSSARARRNVAVGAALPALLLLALYAKNWALFDVFGATSSAGGNLTHVTVSRLPDDVRAAWVRSGKLSPFAGMHVYAPPGDYLRYAAPDAGARFRGIQSLDELEKPSLHSPNFNHWVFLDVNRRRRDDALTCIEARPAEYASTVFDGLLQVFGPSTRWHPRDQHEGSPHFAHRRVLGRYEDAYNAVVHGIPFAPLGLYLLLPAPLLWACRRVISSPRRIRYRRARAALLAFSVLQIVYLIATSALFTIGESARYRYQVEPQIWLLCGLSGAAAWASFRRAAPSLDPKRKDLTDAGENA